jgi:integrase
VVLIIAGLHPSKLLALRRQDIDFDRSVIIVVRNLTRFGEGSPENIPQRARSLRCSPPYAPLLACGRRESVSAADWFSAIVTAVRSAQGSARFRLLRHARLPSRATPSIPQRFVKAAVYKL